MLSCGDYELIVLMYIYIVLVYINASYDMYSFLYTVHVPVMYSIVIALLHSWLSFFIIIGSRRIHVRPTRSGPGLHIRKYVAFVADQAVHAPQKKAPKNQAVHLENDFLY